MKKDETQGLLGLAQSQSQSGPLQMTFWPPPSPTILSPTTFHDITWGATQAVDMAKGIVKGHSRFLKGGEIILGLSAGQQDDGSALSFRWQTLILDTLQR